MICSCKGATREPNVSAALGWNFGVCHAPLGDRVREHLESLFLVIGVGSTVAIGAKRAGIPYNIALVIVGLLLVFVDALPHSEMDPEMILVLFLPVLVFEGALSADAGAMKLTAKPILALAVPGVMLSLLGTAGAAQLVLGLPFAAALLLGALLSITDTVSVLLAFRSVRVPHRLAAIMEGESLFNDGTALVLVTLSAGVLTSGHFELSSTLRGLMLAMVGGLGVGGVCGFIGAAVLRRAPDHLTTILASVVLVFASSLIAERIHASHVIAVVVAGLLVSSAARSSLPPSRVLALQGFWEALGFGLNVLLFLLVGMQIQARMLIEQAGPIALAIVAMHVGRAITVYGCFGVMKLLGGEKIPMRWQHVMLAGNIKGALSMAAVLALPANTPYRAQLITIVFGVTFVTLVCQALPFGRVLKLLGVAEKPPSEKLERARATLVAARRGQTELDSLLAAGLLSRSEHARRRAAFQREILEADRDLRTDESDGHGDAAIEQALLLAQKAAVLDAARRGLIGEAVASERVGNIDMALVHIGGHEHGTEEAGHE